MLTNLCNLKMGLINNNNPHASASLHQKYIFSNRLFEVCGNKKLNKTHHCVFNNFIYKITLELYIRKLCSKFHEYAINRLLMHLLPGD